MGVGDFGGEGGLVIGSVAAPPASVASTIWSLRRAVRTRVSCVLSGDECLATGEKGEGSLWRLVARMLLADLLAGCDNEGDKHAAGLPRTLACYHSLLWYGEEVIDLTICFRV